ncbi:mannitol dehydrogenase family protein [Rhizobium sp. VS19-DR96]|uniref:mannitol dehydrogenase family protein n=1 Tax=unclassified Rhizobium TaxID=2613769 RepID=UPI00398C43CD
MMQRLNAQTILPEGVQAPGYNRSSLKPGIVHLGIGAFHRAHQAVYTDDALAHEFGDWGIVGASLRSTDIVQALILQDCLHSVVTRDHLGDRARIVGSTVRAIAATEDRDTLVACLSDPAIRIVTLTVSEKAYGIDPSTGGLDTRHAAVAHDLADPHHPVGAVGLIVEGLARRNALGHAPFTVLCCDNLPGNGHVVRRLVIEMAFRRDPKLGQWIETQGRFPSSMVDRIVPAATDAVRERAASIIEAADALALETEPFTQWVIENSFVSGRPAWEAGGALFVEAVEPYEKMKLRLLNGSHSLIAYLGQLRGLEYVRDVMAKADYQQIVRHHMQAALPTLDPVPGIDLDAYIEQLIARFANPAIAHRTAQIAMDGTQKLPQRIFAPASETIAAGKEADAFAYATALWIAYVLTTENVDDPRADELRKAAQHSALRNDGSAPFFDIPGLFPPALTNDSAWRSSVDRHLKSIQSV